MPKTFKIGDEITVNRLGYGAMQITGPGVWGPHRDTAEAIRVLKRLPELGINFIDTADSYGPDVSEQLIRQALHRVLLKFPAREDHALGRRKPRS